MTYQVIQPFYDKNNKEKRYNPGDSFDSKDPKRVAFLLTEGFIKEVEAEAKPRSKKNPESE